LFHGTNAHNLAKSAILQQQSPYSRARHVHWQSLDVFLQQTCVRPGLGLFAVVSQIAPTGGDNFEDLSVLDPSNPNEWLLVVVSERQGDLLIYRKLYTGEG
jgi:hypothetical protein